MFHNLMNGDHAKGEWSDECDHHQTTCKVTSPVTFRQWEQNISFHSICSLIIRCTPTFILLVQQVENHTDGVVNNSHENDGDGHRLENTLLEFLFHELLHISDPWRLYSLRQDELSEGKRVDKNTKII